MEVSKTPENVATSLDLTSVGNIPNEWQAKRLEELTEGSLYGAAESAEDWNEKEPRYIRVTDLSADSNQLKDKEKKSISRDRIKDKYLLDVGDMVFARSGSVGKTYYHRDSDEDYAYGGYLIKFPIDKTQINPVFLQQYTNSPAYWNWVKRITRTGAQPNINAREYSSLLLPLPPLPEQRKIASVLYNVDQAIQKTEEIIDQTERVKKGVMQWLFTEGYFEHEVEDGAWQNVADKKPVDWEMESADSLIEITRGASPRPVGDPELFGGDIPWVKISDVERDNSQTVSETESTVTEKGSEKSKVVGPGSLIVANSGTVGFSVITEMEACVHDGWLILRDYDELDKKFLLHYINWNQRFLKSLAPGSTQINLNTQRFGVLDIPVPELEEQRKIASVLDGYDNAIYQARQYKKQLKRLKKGLMQDLLTGAVRTKDRDIAVVDAVREVDAT